MPSDFHEIDDVRKQFISTTVKTLLGGRLDGGKIGKNKSANIVDDDIGVSDHVARFLDDPSCVSLIAYASPDGHITYSNGHRGVIVTGAGSQEGEEKTNNITPTSSSEISFIKLRPEPLTDENIYELVQVSSMLQSPVSSLYHTLHSVYGPMLRNSSLADALPSRLHQLLADLDVGLGEAVKIGQASAGPSDNLASIIKPSDEFTYWENQKGGRGREAEAIRLFQDALQPIKEGWKDVFKLDFDALKELLEVTQTALDEIWRADLQSSRHTYPQSRMTHLLDVVGNVLVQVIQKRLASRDLWHDSFGEIRTELKASIKCCEKWSQASKELTGTFWASTDGKHPPWKGGSHSNSFLDQMTGRLEQILNLRMTHEELLQLLSEEESRQLQPAGGWFGAFDGINPLLYNPFTQPQWKDAISKYQKSLTPVEQQVAANFRWKTSPLLAGKPDLLLREFHRFCNLVTRPTIQQLIAHERQVLLTQLIEHVDHMENELDHRTGLAKKMPSRGRNLSPKVSGVIFCRQLKARVDSILGHSMAFIKDLPKYDALEALVRGLQEKVKAYERELYDAWLADAEDMLTDDDSALKVRGRLMEINNAGLLTVNYSERLVTLLREHRQLIEYGYAVPSSVTKAVEEGERYYRYGVMLKKVANFYNNMEHQIIDVQRPMLLDALLAFEEVVLHPPTHAGGRSSKSSSSGGGDLSITWSNPAECQTYVDRLLKAADRLSFENRKLRRIHGTLATEIAGLMAIDLLRSRDAWKAKWVIIKDIVNKLQSKFPVERMNKWLLHWDRQLYKALESGYQMGLESLNENLGEIKCDLVFANKTLQFKPPFEEIRMLYYREMKKFMAIPNAFEGFGSNPALYRNMVGRNEGSLFNIYEKGKDLFCRLALVLEKYEEWTVLGSVDLCVYVEEHVHEASEYEVNFKVIKSKRKEVDRLPDFEVVDCLRVSCTPVKSSVEDLLQRLNDALMVCLRKGVLTAFKEVDSYLEQAMDKLSSRPRTVDEIGQAKKAWKEITDAKDSMRQLLSTLLDNKRILLQYAPGSNVDTSEVVSKTSNIDGEGGRWDNFEVALEAFNAMIEEQKESLKTVLDEEVITMNMTIEKFGLRWKALRPHELQHWEAEEVKEVFSSLDDWEQQFTDLRSKAQVLTDNCLAFAMPQPRFDSFEVIEGDIKRTIASWAMLREYLDQLKKMAATDWISFRSNIFALQDLATLWQDRIKESIAEGSFDFVAQHLQGELERIKKALPALKYCRGDPFKEEHWSALLQGKFNHVKTVCLENLTVGHFLSKLDVLADPNMLTFVKHLQARAQGEVTIREAMQELIAWSQTAELKLTDHEEAGRKTMLIKDWKDLMLEVGDKQSLLSSLKESQFFKAFADQGAAYETKLTVLDYYLQILNSVQRKWVYLEPIFGRGSLPSEQARFRRVDEHFRDIMGRVEMDPKLFNLADEQLFPHMRETLTNMQDQLDRCQKALADFLEEKRSAMPRFYFIGDDDLLEILGQARNPVVIQSHLKKLFQGIHKVTFREDQTEIIAIQSAAGETVALDAPVKITEKVEHWLEELVVEMKRTLAIQLTSCLDRELDLERYPSQILCLAEEIKFTARVEAALEKGRGGVGIVVEELKSFLAQYTQHDLSQQPLLNLKVKALVLDLVHHMEVVRQLQQGKVTVLDEWLWQKQLRYYLPRGGGGKGGGGVILKMSTADFMYTYEYQGNAPKLVHTALTDKCYLTLTQAVHMGFGGNPYGPAGTGKTESVKALGQAMGRQVLVFNCDEGIDFQSMGRIFIGLVKCGAWGCFDEFNRLKEDQLSAISQQIQVIQDGIKARLPTIKLLGRSIDLDSNAGIFVTLNPAGKGYGGRSKLPDNLKALFRPIAMGSPDNDVIAEVILYSEGFKQAEDLASKIVSLFNLSKQLLSAQQHYDWGLRALKAVLNTGGKLIQRAKREGGGQKISHQTEKELLIKAVRVNTLSKLTFFDTRRFLALIGDVFPNVDSNDIAGGELEEAIRDVMTKKPFNLEADETEIRKMLQLKEALDQRMGCVIVGPSGCGKSTVWRVLQAALVKCGQPVVVHVMNPKSMPRQQLLGLMDLDTREWFDGVLTNAARQVVREPPEIHSWIVCDGDIDPEWIESLNSVLDDNHLLTLPNGERISFGSNVNFLFETHDLSFASPATVSRMGMIFLSDEHVNIKRLVNKWLNQQPEDTRTNLGGWLDDLFYKALKSVLTKESVVDTTLVGIALNGLSQLIDVKNRGEFVCALMRGLGANLTTVDRVSFAKDVFQWAGERPADIGAPLDCYYAHGGFQALVTDLHHHDGQLTINDIRNGAVIHTVSVQRTIKMLEPWIDRMEPFILVGPEGCGKNMLINHIFRRRRSTSIAILHCNARTTAEHVITKIAQTCSLFSSPEGRVYRPRDGDRLVLYLKDINLPKPDQYNSCMLIAFLQQLLTSGGFYDKNLEFLRLEKVQIVASMNAATTTGRHSLSSRFTANVRIGVVDYPDTNELASVYNAFLEPVLEAGGYASGINAKVTAPPSRQRLAATMVELYEMVKSKFTVDDQRHYIFTPRDLTNWVQGLLRYDGRQENLLNILAYEAMRIFRDRLIDSKAEQKLDTALNSMFRLHWKHNLALGNGLFSTLGGGVASAHAGGRSSAKEESKSSGNDYHHAEEKDSGVDASSTQSLDPLLSRMSSEDFANIISQGLMYYEREEKDLNMLLFPEILSNVARLDRALSQRGGQLLLVGRSGVGKRNAALLVSHMLRYRFHSPAITRSYGLDQFYADLKMLIQASGIEGEHVVLYMEDRQLSANTAILETLNSLLSAGEIPGLYTHEELEPLLAPLRERAAEDGTYRTVYDFFISRVRRNFHVILSMDATNPGFLIQCESNPAVYRCQIIWLGEWRRSSLQVVPRMMEGVKELLVCIEDGKGKGGAEGKSMDEECNGGQDGGKYDDLDGGESKGRDSGSRRKSSVPAGGAGRDGVLETILSIHDTCAEAVGASPREYIAFLQTWYRLHDEKRERFSIELSHLKAGLDTLQTAEKTVDDLSRDATVQQKELQVAQVAADQAMDEITKALSDATERRKEVEELRVDLATNEKDTQQRKLAIEQELASITPILESAKQAVGQIKSDHLNEIRSLIMPPEAIADVLSAVLMLLGINDTSWLSMKRFLGNRGVKDEILNFNAHRLTPDIRKAVSNHVRSKQSSFEKENITRVSVAAAPLAIWVKANIKYSIVLEKIEPLEADLAEAVAILEKSQHRLMSCEAELVEIDYKVKRMKQEFTERTREAERLRAGLEKAKGTLDKAQHLLGQLSGEKSRWKEQARALRHGMETLPLQMLLAAAFTTYLGQTAEEVRARVLQTCIDLTHLEGDFSFRRAMCTESRLLQWKAEELPSDSLSQENGIVIAYSGSTRVPFIIDPACAALQWLKTYLAEDPSRPLEVVQSQDPRFTNQVELAVRFGKTLLVLDADGLEPLLYPIARRDLTHQGSRWVVQVGDKVIDFNDTFRLVLTTRDPEPRLPPDASALLTQVNFTITKSGLEGQLLGLTIQHEQPELEHAKTEMLRQEEDFKVQLATLEQQLLESLATAEGNILDDTTLIASLSKTQEKALEIQDALRKSALTNEELDRQRECYRSFAKDGSQMFFLLQQLQSLNHMYQFSLAAFVTLFKKALAEKMKFKDVADRLVRLKPLFESSVYLYVARAVFKDDQSVLAMHLINGMYRGQQLEAKEWEVFTGKLLSDSAVTTAEGGRPRDFPSWAASERATSFRCLSENLPRLLSALELQNDSKWSKWATVPECEREFPPLRSVTPFQKVLLVQALRPDRLHTAIQQFATELLRLPSLSPPSISFVHILNDDSSPSTPILFITTAGSDPTKELEEHASKAVGRERYHQLAMGGGQQEVALTLLRQAAQAGDWLCLKNLHLVAAWLPTFEKEYLSLTPSPDFRLWLTTEPHQDFPPILLQQSVKLTYESPPGIKKNLQRTYGSTWSTEYIESGSILRAQLLFVLAWFHSIMQERRTYLPQGWTKFYEFSNGDLRAGSYVMEEAALAVQQQGGKKGGPVVEWETIHGVMEDAIYGGRIDNPYDLRVLQVYLLKYFNSKVIVGDKGAESGELMKGLYIPDSQRFGDYIRVIDDLLDSDAPYLFGLPDNIERTIQRAKSATVIAQLKRLDNLSTEARRFDREQWRTALSPMLETWQNMTSSNPELVRKKDTDELLSRTADLEPVDTFALMEDAIAADLCALVNTSLASIRKVVYGSGLLTPAVQDLAAALLSGRVPVEWSSKWEGPLDDPQAWLRGLLQRRVAIIRWTNGVVKKTLLQNPLRLSDLFNPSAFLNALRQQTSRRMHCPMDQLRMVSCWEEGRLPQSTLVVAIEGLLLQGASFVASGLADSAANAPEFVGVPPIYLAYIGPDEVEPYRGKQTVALPLYMTSSRERIVVEVETLTVDRPPEEWILAGAALFLGDD